MSKTKEEILYDHGIDIGRINDDFNTQLLHAMERYAESLAASREEGLKGDPWISVEDDLPDYYTHVLVFVPERDPQKVWMAWRASDGDSEIWTVSVSDVVIVYPITHWMPLPLPPGQSPTSLTPGNSERMTELEKENVELREVVRQLNAGMIHFSTLDKMPTLDLLDRKAVIAHVVNIGKKKVVNPKDTNQPYYSDSERMEKEAIEQRVRELESVLYGYEQWEADLIGDNRCWGPEGMRSQPIIINDLWDKLIELQTKRNNVLRKSKSAQPMDKEGEK